LAPPTGWRGVPPDDLLPWRMRSGKTIQTGHPVRVALLGCGRIAALAHVAILRDHPLAQLVAVADLRAEAREHASRHVPRVSLYDDFHALLHEEKPDAVLIALPTLHHRDAAVASLEAGAHLYLEKPIAESLSAAKEIHDAWTQTKLIGRIGFNARFGRLYRELMHAVANCEIGQPVAARTAFTARWPSESTWRLSPSTGGGALLELVSHHVDLIRHIFGSEIVSVSARTWSNRGNDESAALDFTLSNGMHVQTLAGYGTIEEDRFEVYGTEGKLTVNRYDSLVVERTGPFATGGLSSAMRRLKSEIANAGYGIAKRRAPGQEPSFSASIANFLESVSTGIQSSPDLTDGLRAIEVIDAARLSAARRETIDLSR